MKTHDGQASVTAETPELLLRLAVENAALVAWSTDRELRVTSFRAPARCASDRPPEDRRGMTLSMLFHADTPDSQPVAVHRRALRGACGAFRFDWEGRPYRGDVFPHKDAEGHVVGCLGFAQPIAEQDQLREELDAIFEHAPVVMILMDRDTRVKKANRLARLVAKRLSGEMNDLRGGEALRCVHALDVPEGCGFGPACKDCRVRTLVLETVETGKVHQAVEVLLLMEVEGKPVERFVLVSAACVNPREKDLVLVCLEDITDRKQMENALKQHQHDLESLVETRTLELVTSEIRYRRLVNRSPGILYVFSSRRGGIFYSNRVESVLGYSVDHLLANPFLWNHSIHPDDRPTFESAIQEAVRNGVFNAEYRIEDARGEWIWLRDCSVAVRHEQDEVVIEGLATDITHGKRAEAALRESHKRLQEALDELRATREQVIQQERLLALGEMASGVGHDLNNSLSPVLGYSEILLEDSRLPGDAREYLKWIRNGARDAAAVVARLREFYRPSSPDESRGPVELAGLLEEVVQLTRPKWRDEAQREGREIELEVRSEDAPLALGNAAELREVLTNLVFNAVDAMPSGGRITLRLRGQSGGAVVEVADTGVGMSDEVRAKCIEPFFTTKGHEGTGLGLSVCHGIVQRHGGRIEVDSSPGRGTTVRVFLPAAEEGLLVEEPEAEVSLPTSRVLYIDDDPRLRCVVADMLQQLRQEVDLAEGGVRGLELLEANDYDLVITDWGMPGMDGYVVTGKIKALRPELPVAMLTGWGSSEASGSMESGEVPDYILSKPPRLDEMRELLMKLMP